MMHKLVPDFILQQFHQGTYHGRFPAVCLFVDVSGFTPLTNTLMAQGAESAELVADALAEVFTPLLQIVAEQGGFVAAFAGDAFKVAFPLEEGNPGLAYRRAVVTAWQMHQYASGRPPFTTPEGDFHFTVKVIVADGGVEWRIWRGDVKTAGQNAVYTFAGEAFARCLEADPIARAGEVVLTTAVARQIPGKAAALTPVEAYQRLESVAETWLESTPRPDLLPDVKTQLATHFFPARLLRLSFRGEFRQVVTLFVNLQSLPDGDDFARTFFYLLQRYDGYLCRIGRIGDRDPGGTLLLFWGAPWSSEHDVARALHFALDLRSAVETPLKAGVSTGLAFAGFIGSAHREEYTCYGAQVNLAARQMVTAAWGEILLDETTARRAGADFRLDEGRQFQLKGFAKARQVFQLQGYHGRSANPFYRGRLVGREQELAQLAAAARPLLQGRFGGVVTISGEAGIGKSRLVHEFLADLSAAGRCQVFLCQTDEILRQSLNPFRYWLRRYFGQSTTADEGTNKGQFIRKLEQLIEATDDDELRTELRRLLSFLGVLVDLRWSDSLYEQLDPQLRFENTLAAIKTLVKAESKRLPLILHVEDIHWLEPDSRTLLATLTRTMTGFPFLIVATARPSQREGEAASLAMAEEVPHTRLQVAPLSPTAVAAMAAARLEGPVAPALVALLVERAEGNPFFVEQILLYLQEQGAISRNGRGWELKADRPPEHSVPADVRQVLVARLDRLPVGVRQVVQAAAVLGREFLVPVLAHMLADEAVMAKVHAATAADIWSALAEMHYLFQHVLLRDAAYGMQLQAQRRRLHGLAAAAIEMHYGDNLGPYYAELAYHAEAAGLQEQARNYWQQAGDVAREAYHNGQATTYYGRALALTTELDGRYSLLLIRESLYELQGLREEQGHDIAALMALVEEMGDAQRQAQVALRRSRYCKIIGEKEQALIEAERAVELARRSRSEPLGAEAYLTLAEALRRDGDLAKVAEYITRALDLAQMGNVPKVEADAQRQMAQNLYYQGDYQGVSAYCRQALDIYRRIGDRQGEARVLGNLGLALAHQKAYDKATDYYERSLAIDHEIGNARGESNTFVNLGKLTFEQGKYEQAEAYLQQALRLFRETGTMGGESTVYLNLGELSRSLGDFAAARAYYDRALSIGRLLGTRGTECTVLNFSGVTFAMEGNYAQARSNHEKALIFCRENGYQAFEGKVLTDLGNALLGLGELGQAATAFQDAAELRHEFKQPHLFLESQAGLARIALAKGDATLALRYVEPVLDYLAEHSLDGAEDPFGVYLICYLTLRANEDGRASIILSTAYRLLQERAAHIKNEARRRSFLENVPANHTLVQLFAGSAVDFSTADC